MTSKTDSKLRCRLFASKLRLRNGTAGFKDILRERFKSRIKQNRQTILDRMRSSNGTEQHFQDALCAYLYDEMSEFDECPAPSRNSAGSSVISTSHLDSVENCFDVERELEVMKQIEDELVQEQLNWILEEYRKGEDEERVIVNVEQTPKLVCCPVCQGGFLRVTTANSLITCARCPIQLRTSLSLEQIEAITSQALNEHAAYCVSSPQFAVINEPNSSGLFVICGRCSLFNALS